jgi:hypothetical protein
MAPRHFDRLAKTFARSRPPHLSHRPGRRLERLARGTGRSTNPSVRLASSSTVLASRTTASAASVTPADAPNSSLPSVRGSSALAFPFSAAYRLAPRKTGPARP